MQDLAHNHDLKIRALVALLVTKLTEKLKHKMDYLDGINAKLEHQTKQVYIHVVAEGYTYMKIY